MFYVTEVLGHVDYILNTNGLVELGFIQNIFPTLTVAIMNLLTLSQSITLI